MSVVADIPFADEFVCSNCEVSSGEKTTREFSSTKKCLVPSAFVVSLSGGHVTLSYPGSRREISLLRLRV